MSRSLIVALALSLLYALPCRAQQWAEKMFDVKTHDFGNIPRGAKAVFRFQLKNIYEEDVHISSVRSSCGCTTPVITKADLKTFETGEIVAELNTRDFLGHKSATLTVNFTKPFPGQVQLNVVGNIRGDVVLTPGIVDLGVVDHGAGANKKISLTYAGRETWKIIDAKTINPHFQVEVFEAGRGRGKVNYEVLVHLTKDAPVGYIKDQLILVTNDAQSNEMPVDVEGRVVSEITVSPASLFLGIVQPGQKVTKQLVVRGRKPFKITDAKCDDDAFQVRTSNVAKLVHLVPVVFTAGDKPGKITRQIALLTDQGADVAPTFTAFAQVVGGAAADNSRAKPKSPPAAVDESQNDVDDDADGNSAEDKPADPTDGDGEADDRLQVAPRGPRARPKAIAEQDAANDSSDEDSSVENSGAEEGDESGAE